MTSVLVIGLLVGLAIGLPISIVMGVVSLVSFLVEGTLPLAVLPQRLFAGVNSFPIMAIPFFILAADLMSGGFLTDSLIRLSNDLVGHITGGLGHVNVLVSMFFAGISGSALADAAGPGAVEMTMMRNAGYDPYYSGALSAATSVIAPIIPPSIIMVMYALSEGRTTVTGLFLAGIVPGVLLGAALMAANHVISVRHNYQFASKRASLGTVARSFLAALPALMMPLIILGGILGGIFTPTEASSVAVAYGLVLGLATRNLKLKDVPKIFLRSALMTSSVLLLVSMGSAFSWALTFAQVPQRAAQWMLQLSNSRIGILALIAIVSTVSGMFIDTLPAVIILTPVLGPVAAKVGIPPLQAAMVIVLCLAVGMLTPPVAPLLFVVSTVGRLKLERLAVATIPLILVELAVVVLVILIPDLSVALPRMLGYLR
jgi:tripartite ATP-independent transporter DctM subunit